MSLPVIAAGLASTELRAENEPNATRAQNFVQAHVAKVRPLEIAISRATWDAYTSGKDEAFNLRNQLQNELDAVLSNRSAFTELSAIKQAGGLDNPVLARQIDVLHRVYLEKQVDPDLLKRMVELSSRIEQAFNVYRAKVDGKEVSENQVRKILKESRNSSERRQAWEGMKGVGPVVEKDLLQLVRLRNQAAASLGFPNFHALQLFLNEQEPAAVLRLFDDLDEMTREPFRQAKEEIDHVLAERCGIQIGDLQPWHYQDPFFQEAPSISDVDLDAAYASADVLKLCRDFYAGIGLPVDDVLARSDLYEKPGKSSHAFCFDIDRAGDVRVLANIQPDEYWMGTMLHELGHAVYSSKNIPDSLPYLLRTEAHMLTTEGIAMMFGRFSKVGAWQSAMGVGPKDSAEQARVTAAASKAMRQQLLIFSRWCQVMLRFEQSLYANPAQDLNKLWWDLVERYQLVKRPNGRNQPDYATKIHVVSYPVYYHNYMMGELFASQVHHAICQQVLKEPPSKATYVNKPAVGEFLQTRIFEPGKRFNWNELTHQATGKELNPESFAEDLKSGF